jgi:2,3-bisphosphoglycerate-dependent phosphoglycerate mutase
MRSSRPAQLLLVRHGETTWNGAGRIQAHRDSPLTARGVAQARAAGARLARERIGALYSSDLGRAQETAREIAAATALPVRTDVLLRERSFGVLEGQTWDEIARDHPIDARLLREDPFRPAPGGESLVQFRDRVAEALRRIAAAATAERVGIVTHGGVLGVLYRTAMGIPLDTPRTYTTPNGGLYQLRHVDGRWVIDRWADVEHLDALKTLEDAG